MNHRYEPIYMLLEKLRWLIFGIPLVLATLMTVSFFLPELQPSTRASQSVPESTSEFTMSNYDSANAVTNGMTATVDEFEIALARTERAMTQSSQSVLSALSNSGSYIVNSLSSTAALIGRGLSNGATFIGHSLSKAALFTAHVVSNGAVFIFQIPSAIFGFVADTPLVSSAIKPADKAATPVIDPHSSTLFTSQPAAPALQTVGQPVPSIDDSAAWPVHGEITTYFGVPHWPFQPTHTGIDISDGRPAGVTPIKPFKPGRVIETVRSFSGLGNYVTVDHGEGITSVYAHLSSISASVGQSVDKNSVLGTQGSTGASTGTHLHLEIRVNGHPVDPMKYIQGHP